MVLMRFRSIGKIFRAFIIASLTFAVVARAAGYATIYGGPTYDLVTGTGYYSPVKSGMNVNNSGMAVCTAIWKEDGVEKGYRAIRWGPGAPAAELGNLGTFADGKADVRVNAIADNGTAVAWALKIVDGVSLGYHAARWEAGETIATELGHLGFDATGSAGAIATAIDSNGNAVGYSWKYVNGVSYGHRAVRWDAGGTAVTELGVLGTESRYSHAQAHGINDMGTIIGISRLNGSQHAVRWDPGSTTAVELGHNVPGTQGYWTSYAYDINNAGVIVGTVNYRAVQWLPGVEAAIELAPVTHPQASGSAAAYINEFGTIAGEFGLVVDWGSVGNLGVRWDAQGTIMTELGNLGTDADGYTRVEVRGISDRGTIVGSAEKYFDGVYYEWRAVIWDLDGSAIDLNTLIDPDSGWKLLYGTDISKNGRWVAGIGQYDPDGPGPLWAYQRTFVLEIPEPATGGFVLCGFLALARRRRPGNR